jgi:NhaA family Na+:H+ antiporter
MADFHTKLHGKATSALEKGFANVVTPFQEFIHEQKTTSMLLLASTLIALIIANSPLADAYHALIETRIGFVLGDSDYAMSLHHWINDGLMALFFFILGLEMKRELLVGELRDAARAIPVFAAAVGGMLVPALLFYAINHDGGTAHGWAIPMATDTAFAIGILALLGTRVPAGLTAFLLALAIIDDMGAVLVIALFYSDSISIQHLVGAALLLTALMVMNVLGMRRPIVYFAGGGLVWLMMLGSGIHATLAGILVAMIVPARPKRSTRAFVRRSRELIDEFEAIEDEEEDTTPVLAKPGKHEVLENLQQTAAQTTTPLQLWERALEHPVALFVLPLFALVNAGIAIDLSALPALLGNSLALGIVLGLVLGKAIGISLPAYALLRLKIGRLPDGVQLGHIIGLALLGGMGFTMSIFIATLGFADDPEQLVIAKAGILTASLLAGACGYLWLRLAVPAHTGD